MIRRCPNTHRPLNRTLLTFLIVCAAVAMAANRVAADPTENLLLLHPHNGVRAVRAPQAAIIEFPILIGPVPGVAPADRFPRQRFQITAATPRGPRAQRRPVYRIVMSVVRSVGSAR